MTLDIVNFKKTYCQSVFYLYCGNLSFFGIENQY